MGQCSDSASVKYKHLHHHPISTNSPSISTTGTPLVRLASKAASVAWCVACFFCVQTTSLGRPLIAGQPQGVDGFIKRSHPHHNSGVANELSGKPILVTVGMSTLAKDEKSWLQQGWWSEPMKVLTIQGSLERGPL